MPVKKFCNIDPQAASSGDLARMMTDAEHAKGETDCQLNEKVMITQNGSNFKWNSGLYYKSFTIVIYDNIDSGQYY
jgi:hypothetical protein